MQMLKNILKEEQGPFYLLNCKVEKRKQPNLLII